MHDDRDAKEQLFSTALTLEFRPKSLHWIELNRTKICLFSWKQRSLIWIWNTLEATRVLFWCIHQKRYVDIEEAHWHKSILGRPLGLNPRQSAKFFQHLSSFILTIYVRWYVAAGFFCVLLCVLRFGFLKENMNRSQHESALLPRRCSKVPHIFALLRFCYFWRSCCVWSWW